MLETCDLIAFASTTSLPRAREFYEDCLGLTVIEMNAYACVFDAHGTMLGITAAGQVAHPGYTVLGWRVANIDDALTRLASGGVVSLATTGWSKTLAESGRLLTAIRSPGSQIPTATCSRLPSSPDQPRR